MESSAWCPSADVYLKPGRQFAEHERVQACLLYFTDLCFATVALQLMLRLPARRAKCLKTGGS